MGLGQPGDQRVGDRLERALCDVELAGNGRRQEVVVRHPRDLDEPHAVLEAGGELFGHLQCQCRLPNTTRPGEGHQPRLRQGHENRVLLELTANQREVPDGEIALGRGQGAQWWELGREPLHAQLEDVLLVGQVAESMGSQILEARAFGEAVFDEAGRRLGDEGLTAVPAVPDAGCPMDVDADIVGATQPALTGVNSDPHHHVLRRLPVLRRQMALDLHGAGDRVECGLEGDEETIALVLHDAAAMLGRRLMHDRVVAFQDRPKGIAELLEHPRRALDVGEEKADRPERKVS